MIDVTRETLHALSQNIESYWLLLVGITCWDVQDVHLMAITQHTLMVTILFI